MAFSVRKVTPLAQASNRKKPLTWEYSTQLDRPKVTGNNGSSTFLRQCFGPKAWPGFQIPCGLQDSPSCLGSSPGITEATELPKGWWKGNEKVMKSFHLDAVRLLGYKVP